MAASDRIFSVHAEGLAELQRDLKKAGASLDDMKDANRKIAQTVVSPAKREVPVKSGRLRSSIKGEGTTRQAVIAAGDSGAPYAGPIHFGWPTRGLGRGRTREQLIGALGSKGVGAISNRALSKSVRQSNRQKGRVRGGPIRPNPFLYRALDQRIDEVVDIYDKRVDEIAHAVESGRI